MTTIRPADEFGSVLAGRSQAAILRARVEELARVDPPVSIDFDGVLTASPSFADEFFAKLDPALLEDGRIAFEHLPASIAAIAHYVRLGRPGALPA